MGCLSASMKTTRLTFSLLFQCSEHGLCSFVVVHQNRIRTQQLKQVIQINRALKFKKLHLLSVIDFPRMPSSTTCRVRVPLDQRDLVFWFRRGLWVGNCSYPAPVTKSRERNHLYIVYKLLSQSNTNLRRGDVNTSCGCGLYDW